MGYFKVKLIGFMEEAEIAYVPGLYLTNFLSCKQFLAGEQLYELT